MTDEKFVIEYNTIYGTKYIDKNIELAISEKDMDAIRNVTKDDLVKKIIGPDRQLFARECLKNSNYYCIKGVNYEFQLK